LKKHARESLRIICIFLEDNGTLFGISCFVRDNNDYVQPRDVAALMIELRQAIENPDLFDDEYEQSVDLGQ